MPNNWNYFGFISGPAFSLENVTLVASCSRGFSDFERAEHPQTHGVSLRLPSAAGTLRPNDTSSREFNSELLPPMNSSRCLHQRKSYTSTFCAATFGHILSLETCISSTANATQYHPGFQWRHFQSPAPALFPPPVCTT